MFEFVNCDLYGNVFDTSVLDDGLFFILKHIMVVVVALLSYGIGWNVGAIYMRHCWANWVDFYMISQIPQITKINGRWVYTSAVHSEVEICAMYLMLYHYMSICEVRLRQICAQDIWLLILKHIWNTIMLTKYIRNVIKNMFFFKLFFV